VTALRVGLSTCPNDTFLFHGLLTGKVPAPGLQLDFVLADVEELNTALAAGALDAGKASFATALRLADRYGVLPVGSALGFGVGPVLLARPGLTGAPRSLLCPGEGTTATLLLRALHPDWTTRERVASGMLRQMRFDQIMPALQRGEADAGVAIHEGRFTYERFGLSLLEDLGASWERLTGGPVPLGGLLARHDLGRETHAALTGALRASLSYAQSHRDEALATMRRHAQELDDDVLWEHVRLYVNESTADLGPVGRRALDELARRVGNPSQLAVLGEQPSPERRSTMPAHPFLDRPGEPGAMGALMDEYARAAEDFCRVVEGFDAARFAAALPGLAAHTVSPQVVCRHVLTAAHRYSDGIRRARGLPFAEGFRVEAGVPARPDALRPLLAEMLRYTEAGLDGLYGQSDEQVSVIRFQVPWGVEYDPDMLLEHAVCHLLRHRRQLERWGLSATPPSP
jgi:1,4-dihydroxy-6-naphthoate synthase